MDKLRAPAEYKALNDETGEVRALISVFGNIDLQGDRVLPGAFAKSIERWRESGDPIPVVVSHEHSDVWQHIGAADPKNIEETDAGLEATYTLDIKENPVAAQAYRLMKRRSLKNHSFFYETRDFEIKNGIRELKELDILEIGPTLFGANPRTDVLAVKSMLEQKTPPWHVESNNSACEGYAVVADETGEVVGCHETREAAESHMAALYANVDDAKSQKAGRRISKATAEKLRQARALIDELLETGEIEDEKSLDPEPGNGTPVLDEDLLRLRAQIEAM